MNNNIASQSRVFNAKRNMVGGIVNNIINAILPFVVRTVLLQELGDQYAGLGGLFTSILKIMNVAELGFSSAVAYGLYKPIVDGDANYICKMLSFYRRVYRIIGLIVLGMGLGIMPFIQFFIKDSYPETINIYILFLLQVLTTVVGYFAFAYKEVLMSASQRQDIISKIDSFVKIIQSVMQIVVLLFFRNYYLYVICMLLSTIARSIIIGHKTSKLFPNYKCQGSLPVENKKIVLEQIKGLAVGKINVASRNSFDNIVLSMFYGLTQVTVYENYYFILNAIIGFTTVITTAITAGVGNSIVTESVEKNLKDYYRFEFYFWIISAWCSVCLACLYQPFMEIWAGKNLVASPSIMFLFVMYFYIGQMGKVRSVYSNAAGIWSYLKKLSACEMVMNLGLNFVLGYFWGMAGIIWATNVTVLLFSIIGITAVLFKQYFKERPYKLYFEFVVQTAITIVIIYIAYKICSYISYGGIMGLIIKLIVCAIIAVILLFVCTMATKRTREYIVRLKKDLIG